ncbi:MAG: hydrolase [Rhizobium sp.]|nr:hydrolase [Rhizobium sp.]
MSQQDFNAFHVRTDDGLILYGRDYRDVENSRLPVVCLSGLSRNSRDFHQFALRQASEGRRVIALDYRGRGLSEWDDDKGNYNVVREARDVVMALDSLAVDKAIFVGTSRGGLIMHMLGALAPGRIGGIVLNDIGPVIESDGLRRILDYLSARAEVSTFSDAAAHLNAIHGAEFPALNDVDWQDMAFALYRQIDGRLVADFDPLVIEPLKTIDFAVPLPDLWKQFELLASIPLLIIRGKNSKLLSEKTVSDMLARHSLAQSITANGQGHAPILHRDDVYQPISEFLRGL